MRLESSRHGSRRALAGWLMAVLAATLIISVGGCGRDTDRLPGAVSSRDAGREAAAPPSAPAAASSAAPSVVVSKPRPVWVVLKRQADLSGAAAIKDWKARGQYVYDRLREVSAPSQSTLRSRHPRMGPRQQGFWIVNSVSLEADDATIAELAADPDVAQIEPDLPYDIDTTPDDDIGADGGTEDGGSTGPIPWGVARVRAPEVWSTFSVRGEGIVVANIDSGVQLDHPALVRQYRGNAGGGSFNHNYNWFDPTNVCGPPSLGPCDNNYHGTHTMGTMVGDDGDPGLNQVGVAPRARWIAVKGCTKTQAKPGCPTTTLLAAGQWVLAPTDLAGQNPRPELRPHVVNNSWGGPGGGTYYQLTVQAWVASGIFPVFISGNSPAAACGTVESPGDFPESYTVGAADANDAIASFSRRGPPLYFPGVKPNIVAPGVDVRSSVPFAFNPAGYALLSGTSMAAPHVAGVVALLWSAVPALIGDIARTREILDQTAIGVTDLSCGGTAWNGNIWGRGRLDAFAAVDLARQGGVLEGFVSSPSGGPLAGVAVHVEGQGPPDTVTDAAGSYRRTLLPGDYDVTFSLFGFATVTVRVTVAAGATANVSVPLSPTGYPVSGTVRDRAGQPLAGVQVAVSGTPLAPVTTDTAGHYTFASLPPGAHDLIATGPCLATRTAPLVVDGAKTLDLLLVARYDAFGYSCTPEPPSFIAANTPVVVNGHLTPEGQIDEGFSIVTLPFSFPYYGTRYGTVYVQSDGFVLFDESNAFPRLAPKRETQLPAPPPIQHPRLAIAPFWTDLALPLVGGIRTELVGVAPHRQFVIEWHDAVVVGSPAGSSVRIQAVLFENGEILVQYAGTGAAYRGSVGVAGPAGTALQFAFGDGIPAGGQAVRFRPPPGLYASTAETVAPNRVADAGKALVVRHYVPSAANPAIYVVDATTNPTTGYGATPADNHTSTYVFDGPIDAIRVLYGGLHHDGTFDCGSDVRRSLADSYRTVFNGSVSTPGQAAAISHLWRPEDLAPETEAFVSLVGFGPRGIGASTGSATKTSPFCNAGDPNGRNATTGVPVSGQSQVNSTVKSNGGRGDFADFDPIRRPARVGPSPDTGALVDLDQVAQNDHTLGLLLPIWIPSGTGVDLPALHPSRFCTVGRFELVEPGYSPTSPTGAAPCPQGGPYLGFCYVPYFLDTAQVRHYNCIARSSYPTAYGAPTPADNRVFNLGVRDDATGRALQDAQGRPLARPAFFRIHTKSSDVLVTPGVPSSGPLTARQVTRALQIGALIGAEPFSIGIESLALGHLGAFDSGL